VSRKVEHLNCGEVRSVYGPLGHSVEDLSIMTELIMSEKMNSYDYYMPPTYFKRQEYDLWKATSRPLRIGYFIHDGYFSCCLSVVKTMEYSIEALKKQGHVLIPLDISYMERILKCYGGLCLNGRKPNMEGEKIIKEY
jgi:Asp-tRNA(Asn)/Glu-tRNA(Gln) amidotransferase A subunit family amidase